MPSRRPVDRPDRFRPVGSRSLVRGDIDDGARWLRDFLGFIGLHDVTVVAANQLAIDAESGLAAARTQIAEIGSLDTVA